MNYKVLSVLSVVASAVSVQGAFIPTRISFESLVSQENAGSDEDDVLLQALRQVGMVSITNIPQFRENKLDTLKALPACVAKSYPESALQLTFPDGTVRQTLASHSIGTTGMSPIPVSANDDSEDCASFVEAADTFRQLVGIVTEVFAEYLAKALHLDKDESRPVLLGKESNKGISLVDLFEQGDHLEHFHCYHREYKSSSSRTEEEAKETIEWHTDQGLALIFTPGSVNGEITNGFYIQLEDGSTEMVHFDQNDDLVILLGDGVNQYLNRALDTDTPLRALPHALRMPYTNNGEARVWYGRMVLPPADALHPLHSLTFGEIRQQMILEGKDAATVKSISRSIGCSDDLVARELSETYDTDCDEGVAAYCWHQCMNFTDYGVSPEVCAAEGLDLGCSNDAGFLWIDSVHDPAFALSCVDLATAQNITVTDDSGEAGHGDDHGADGHEHDDGMDHESSASLSCMALSFLVSACVSLAVSLI